MATPRDNEMLVSTMLDIAHYRVDNALPQIKNILNVGCRENQQRDIIVGFGKMIGADIVSMDFDMGLGPGIVWNLNSPRPLMHSWDMIICAQTLMYIDNPIGAAGRLLDATNMHLVIQDTVVRPRTEIDTETLDHLHKYTDKNRFKSHTTPELMETSDKKYWDFGPLTFNEEALYENPDGSGNYSAIWIWNKS